MSKGFWFRAGIAVWGAWAASVALAEVPRDQAPSSQSGGTLVALDDQDLKDVHGAGIDDDVLRQLGQGGLHQSDEHQRQQASRTQQNAALMAALELQANLAPRLAASAVNTVTTAAQVGGTLLALTPVTALVPIGLPLFGLPTLPSQQNNQH